MNSKIIILIFIVSVLLGACKNDAQNHSAHSETETYTCPMHPQIIRNKPGNCPICGMKLVKKENNEHKQKINDVDLTTLLKPTDEYVISSIPTVTMEHKSIPLSIKALGSVAYDTRQLGSIAARISGRIERLYVRSRYQKVQKGQKIMDIYSPEILTAEENLLLLLNNDPSNTMMITSAKQKLLLLGMSSQQLQQIIKKRTSDFTISVFSNYSGFVKDVKPSMLGAIPSMNDTSTQQTAELSVKEGMYVQKGQTVFNVYDASKTWAILNIYPQDIDLIQTGQQVNIVPEVAKDKVIKAKIDFIEPFYQNGVKTITARVYFNNAAYRIPIGSQIEATISGPSKSADWLPSSSIVSLGLDKIIFIRLGNAFIARKVNTGIQANDQVQILNGLKTEDKIAENAQFLMDSESFIKVNN